MIGYERGCKCDKYSAASLYKHPLARCFGVMSVRAGLVQWNEFFPPLFFWSQILYLKIQLHAFHKWVDHVSPG